LKQDFLKLYILLAGHKNNSHAATSTTTHCSPSAIGIDKHIYVYVRPAISDDF